jgi:purine nucleosidase
MVGGPSVVCDPGVDDFLALLVLAGAGVPPSGVVGTAGNVGAELAFRNAAGIASLLGLDCPVAKGCEEGLSGPYPDTGEPFHGTDGLGGIGSLLPKATPSAALDPVLIVKGTVLATGPLTIVATALSAGNAIEDIVWMGGAVACGGNMTPSAEFNAWLDPEAADQVLSSSTSLCMVPLDVTHQIRIEPADLTSMAKLGRVGALAAQSCSYFHGKGSDITPHDAVAAVALLNPDLFEWEERWVRCELAGTWTRGMTVVDRRQHGERGSVRVAVAADVSAVNERIFEAIRSLG